MFYERLKEVCKMRGTKLTPLLEKANIPTSSIGRLKKGSIPNGETLIKLAKSLNVSADYLLGLSNEENEVRNENEKERKMIKSTEEFDQEVFNVLTKINNGENWKETPKNLDDILFADVLQYIHGQELAFDITEDYPDGGKTLAGTWRFKRGGIARLSRPGLNFIENFKTKIPKSSDKESNDFNESDNDDSDERS